jgi:hypothetical protein
MASNFFKVKNGLNVQPQASPTLDENGDIAYDSATHKIKARINGSTDDIATSTDLASKASTTLNNLGTTAINTSLIPDTTNTYSLGDAVAGTRWANVLSTNFLIPGTGVTGRFGTSDRTSGAQIGTASNAATFRAGNTDGAASGELVVRSGDVINTGNSGNATLRSGDNTGTGTSGVLFVRSGNTAAGNSGSLTIKSGDSSAGGTTGDVNISAGTTSGTRGAVAIDGRYLKVPTAASNPATAVEGAIFYDTATDRLKQYNGTVWQTVDAGFTSPTVTILTSGSGTYNKPASAVALKVRLVGGGAGGGGGGGAGFGNGTNGGNTTFGSLTANGGTGGTQTASNASGGSASGGDININGSNGGPRWSVSGFPAMGGMGGSNPLGMPGANGELNGGSGTTGGGWGGAGGGGGASLTNPNGGGGGGGGAYCEKWISSPSASYSYAIGAGGAGGAGGTFGAVGGSGSGGVVIVEEYY